jgi:DNA-binding CsgD family transcriptional regulator
VDQTIVGRDAVLDRAWRALTDAGVVVVEGPAGIGKTAVWRALLARADRAGWSVLRCAPTESETVLPYAALADLLGPLSAAVDGLPGPQRAAADLVLLAGRGDEPADGGVDERAVGAATRSLLETARHGSADRGLLVAVDDARWLDGPSERALRFALRRVRPVATLVTGRTGSTAGSGRPGQPGRPSGSGQSGRPGGSGGSGQPGRPSRGDAPLGLDDGPDPITRIDLGPLGVGALYHVLRDRLDATLSRPLLARITHESGGNPLLAIEMARAVLRRPRPPALGEDLPVASSMQPLVDDTVAALPAPTRDAIRLASLLTVPTLRDLDAAGVPTAAFDPAEAAGLVAVTSSRVRFAHPVYAAAVRAAIPAGQRRGLHRRLAEVVADPDERVRHLALCTVEPDADIAAELSRSAQRHRGRGAPVVAAELHHRAAELTPATDVDGQVGHRLAAVQCLIDSGDYVAAASAADAVAAGTTGDSRAEALLLRAVVAWCADEPGRVAVDAAERALAETSPGSTLAGRVHAYLASFSDIPAQTRHHAEAAIARLAEDDGELLAGALSLLHGSEVRLGRPERPELLERALAVEGDEPSWFAGTVPAIWWKATDDHARARARLHRMLDRAVARGDEPLQHELLAHLGETELLAGRWDAAEAHIAAAHDLGEQLGTGLVAERWLAGLLAAVRGGLDEAGPAAEAGLRLAAATDDAWCRRIHLQLAAFVALSAGRMGEAATAYGQLAETVDAMGLVEPLPLRFEADWVEACVGAGDLVTAATAMARLADRHRRLPRPWTTLGLARGRVLVDGATGADTASAVREAVAARESVPADVLPLDRARCLLVVGVAHRRSRRKREAREALAAAAGEFDALGALAFAERARTELERVVVRAAGPLELTATEQRVARLAARGRTNRAIADELFISPKTVEANLARVYRKLGISSRAELGAAMVDRPTTGPGRAPGRETPDSRAGRRP